MRRNSFSKSWTLLATSIFLALTIVDLPSRAATNSEPVNKIVRDLIVENGGKTNTLPLFTARDHTLGEVKKDEYGAQLFFAGNQMEPLLNMFTNAYGNPPYVRTNDSGMTMFQFNKNQAGVGIMCSLSTPKSGAVTQLIILGPKGIAFISGLPDAMDAKPKSISSDEARAVRIAVKAAADRGVKGDLDGIASHNSFGWVISVFDKKKGGPLTGSVATVGLNKDFKVKVFDRADAAK